MPALGAQAAVLNRSRSRCAPAWLPWYCSLAFLLLGALLPPSRLMAQVHSETLAVVTTARAAHQLSVQEARRAYPVRLHAVVTFYDVYLDTSGIPVLFVSDSSGSIYVALSARPAVPLRAGDLVDITGVSSSGLFAPIVAHAQAHVVGGSNLPRAAPRVSLGDMLTGSRDGQWVEVEALVQAVRESGPHVILDLLLRDGTITAVTGRQSNVDYSRLVDSGVVLRGVVSPNFNNQGQVTGAHLLFPEIGTVKITEAAPSSPFALPVQGISSLLRFSSKQGFQHRVHIRGAITLLWPGRMICIQDGSKSLCAQTRQDSPLRVGEIVDVIGFPAIGAFTPTLVEAQFRRQGSGAPRAAVAVSAKQALGGAYDGQLISIEARIIDKDKGRDYPNLILSSGGVVFSATLPSRFIPSGAHLDIGSLVRVTGICSVQSAGVGEGAGEGFAIPKSFSILQRSMADVVVVETPSWWSAERTLYVLALAVTCMGLAMAAIVFLRHRIRQQTATIRAQLAETSALKDAAEFQAMHDSLTGLYNRKAIFDAMHREFELAARSGTSIGVLMLDLDHFKRINDTYGHFAGDCVLKEAVRRILETLRSTDLVGRYGGEEFLVVLPDCERDQIVACAERIRSSIANVPMIFDGIPLAVTTSIGAVAANLQLYTEHDALSTADLALYDAKNSGRNRVAFHELHHQESPAQMISLPAVKTTRA